MSAVVKSPVGFDAARVAEWWRAASGASGGRGDPAMMAELRRAHSPRELALTASFHRARNELTRMGGADLERLARVLGVLAHAKEDTPSIRVGAALGGRPTPAMHPLRFQRLLQVEDWDDESLHAHGVRLVRLLKGRVDVEELAWSLYRWNEQTRQRWALAYYESIETQEL